MAAVPPSFDPRGEPDDPRDAGLGEPGAPSVRQQRVGYVLVGVLLVALLVVAVLLFVL